MNEYDLMRSIGELDERLLRRYDAETARAVRRTARRRRLILDLILLLLLAGAVLWLILGRSAAAQGVETQLTEAAAAPEPLPFSFPTQLRQLPEGWYERYANYTIVDFNWKEKTRTEEDWQSFWTDIQGAMVEEARKVQAEKDARFPYYGTLPAPDPASSCSLIPEGDGWKLDGAFYRAMPEPEYDCGWRVDLAAFQPLGQSPEGAAVYGCPAGSRQPVLLLLESGDAEKPSRRWLYCPSLLNPDPTALALSDFQLTQDPALTETLWTLHTDAVQAGEAVPDAPPSILSLDQQSVCLVLKELPCLSYWISYVRVLGERQAFVRNRPQQRDLFWSDPTAIWRREAPIDMNESLCRKLDRSASTFLPQSREDRFADPALQARFAEAAAGLDLNLEADALRFFESLCQYLKDETRYFYHRELGLEALTLYRDGVISAVYRGQRASGMVQNFCQVFVSQADGHLICLLDEKGLIDPTDLDRSWVSGAYLELDPGQSALLRTHRDAERVYYDCMLCIRNPGSDALRVRLYGSYRGRDGASPPRMAAYALSEAEPPQGAGDLFLLPPGETLLRVCFVDPTRSSGTLRHSTLPQLLYLVTDPPPGLQPYGPEPFLEPCDNSAVTPICSQDNNQCAETDSAKTGTGSEDSILRYIDPKIYENTESLWEDPVLQDAAKELCSTLDLGEESQALLFAEKLIPHLSQYCKEWTYLIGAEKIPAHNDWVLSSCERFPGGWCVSYSERIDTSTGFEQYTELEKLKFQFSIRDSCIIVLFHDSGEIIQIMDLMSLCRSMRGGSVCCLGNTGDGSPNTENRPQCLTAFPQPYIVNWAGTPIWSSLKEEYGWNQSTSVDFPALQSQIQEWVDEKEIASVSQVADVSKLIEPYLSELTGSDAACWLLMSADLDDNCVWCLWYLEANPNTITILENSARNESVPGVYDAGLLVYISALDGHLIGIEGFPELSTLSDHEAEYAIERVSCPPEAMYFPMLRFEEHLKDFAKKHKGYGIDTTGKEDRFPDEALQEALAAETRGEALRTPEAAARYAVQICDTLIERGYLDQDWSPELLYFYTDDVVRVTIRPEKQDKLMNEGWELCFSATDGHIISIYYVDFNCVYSISPKANM